MAYDNDFLREFAPVFTGILKALGISIGEAELEILDEEQEGAGNFELTELLDVLDQIAAELNFLTIYTERPAYFEDFKETLYEENGLLVNVRDKNQMISNLHCRANHHSGSGQAKRRILLDFERRSACYKELICARYYYIPIYKKCWHRKKSGKDGRGGAENLDILVPIGYNTVAVGSVYDEKKTSYLDKFELAFYTR